jgi:Myb/SANT-like DNA-binding domain
MNLILPCMPKARKLRVMSDRAVWTQEDETVLLAFLLEHKAEVGDGINFKQAVWTAAASEMAKRPHKGAAKSANSCKNKWAKVRDLTWVDIVLMSNSVKGNLSGCPTSLESIRF